MIKRALRSIAIIVIAIAFFTECAFAAVMGDTIDRSSVAVNDYVGLGRSVYWTGSDLRTENYIEYVPDESVYPVVVYGSRLLNYGKFSTMAGLLESDGKHVIAGINGDYYNTATFEPCGIVICGGELLSSDGGLGAVGFRADGSTVIGSPCMKMSVSFLGQEFYLASINKASDNSNFSMYTYDYSITSRTTGDRIMIVLSGDESDGLSVNCEKFFSVDEVVRVSGAYTLPEGKYVLSISMDAPESLVSAAEALMPGDMIKLTVSADKSWDDVIYAVGSLYRLVENGSVCQGLEKTAAPRTAVGVKEDGTVVFYTIDGRQPGYSTGAGMSKVAERLVEMGCVEAGILDGGGSTTLNAIYPGDEAISQINRPSDGIQRSVTNYIMLVTDDLPTGTADRLVLYPVRTNMLCGAELSLTVKAVDRNGYAAEVPGNVSFYTAGVSGNVDENGVFTAKGSGEGTVTVSAGGVRAASASVRVISDPDNIVITDESSGKTVTSISIHPGESISLTAESVWNHIKLLSKDECYTWRVEGNIGKVDENGTFTAYNEPGSGMIVVSAGETCVSVPVELKYPVWYFRDVSESDWFAEGVRFVAENGLFHGTDDLIFSPYDTMSRAMMAMLLYNRAGCPYVGEYEQKFADVPADEWYSDAVAWAAMNGIVSGNEDGKFLPEDPITREQMALIFKNYFVYSGGTADCTGDIGRFADAESVSGYAVDAVRWAVGTGLIGGDEKGCIDPQGTAERSHVAVMMQRFCGIG